MTRSGIESATFRLVAQGLNKLRHRVPHIRIVWLCDIDLLKGQVSYYTYCYLFICLFIYLFIYLFVYLFVCLFIYLFVRLFVC